jgi:hypothetical protein
LFAEIKFGLDGYKTEKSLEKSNDESSKARKRLPTCFSIAASAWAWINSFLDKEQNPSKQTRGGKKQQAFIRKFQLVSFCLLLHFICNKEKIGERVIAKDKEPYNRKHLREPSDGPNAFDLSDGR